MKKIIAFVIALLLMFSLCACGNSENEEVTLNTETEETNGNVGNEQAANDSEEGEANIAGKYEVWIRSGDILEKTYKKFLWSDHWTGSGWVSADGVPLRFELPELESEIPEIHYCDDFEIIYGENVSYGSLSVYDENYEMIHMSASQEVLGSLQEGTYYLAVSVKVQGRYIEKEKKYEYSGYDCVCKLLVDGEASE